jgi:DNA-binding winged helix-turn-helix (wHTH) protein
MHSASEALAGIAFGRFLLLPHRRELLAEGRPIKLGGRAFDVLMALIEARGAVVSKHALMARVWPDRIVEENNLQWQISALRAAFGADRNLIRTVSGRGYQFTAEIDTLYGSPEADAGTAIADAPRDPREARRDGGIPGELPPANLPEPISELIGRDDVLGEILSLASAHRLVTLTGAGGIGKTRLAVAAARRLLPQFADGVWLAEFSPIADAGLVPVAVAAAIGLDLGGDISAPRVSQALAGRVLLLVLDTCEHVIGAAAALAEAACEPAGRCISSPPAASRCERKASGLSGARSPYRRKMPRMRTTCCATAGFAICRTASRGGAAFYTRPTQCSDDRGDLSAARRHPAGDRAGGGARRRPRS